MLTFCFDPFPVLHTNRMILRQLTHEDAEAYFQIRSDEQVMEFIPRPLAKSPADAQVVIDLISAGIDKNETINWALELKTKPGLIGVCGYVRATPENHRAEIGYILNRHYHRQGLMQEALEKIIEYGFSEMNLHSIEAVIMYRNKASASLIEKCSFVKEAHLKDYQYHRQQFEDTCFFSRLNTRV
jgi:ribosomal-protein-alanine N-acetyltransferase